MISWQMFLENKLPWVYHVTLQRNLPGIAAKGLAKGGPITNLGFEKDNQMGLFFSEDLRVALQRYHLMNHSYGEAALLRFKLNTNKSHKDNYHGADAGDRYYTGIIPPVGIQLWDGQQWTTQLTATIREPQTQIDDFSHVPNYRPRSDGPRFEPA